MTDQYRSASCTNSNAATPKVANDLTPRKTMFVLVIVVGCFAVLWPKVFYPMLVGSANQYIKPSPIDKTTGCCDVISEIDVNTIKIMSELCSNIVQNEDLPLSGKEIVMKCRSAVLETCGIDISAVLQEQVRLGQTVKQILDEIRSLNGSLCLKYNFGVAPWRLGVPHRVNIKVQSESVRQERPPHLRTEMVHPAFRERGRAIPQAQTTPSPSRPPPRIVEGRPGPIPGMRPTMGGPGHVVPPPKQGTGSMGLIMPIYTIGIVIFFTYTVMKVVFKKQPVHGSLYPQVEPDRNFRKEVFESERVNLRQPRDGVGSKIVVNAMSALLDEVDQEIEARKKASDVTNQEDNLANGNAVKPQEEQASVKIVGMEMTASCEGGKKWSRPSSPVLPNNTPAVPKEPSPPPQEIYLEGALPPQSQLLVTDSATEEQKNSTEDETPIVLAGKMTLSVISLDSSENGNDDSNLEKKVQFDTGARSSSSNASEEFEKIDIEQSVEAQIAEIIEEARNITAEVELVKDKLKETENTNEEQDDNVVDEYELNENEKQLDENEEIDDGNNLEENEKQLEENDKTDEDEVEEELKEDAEIIVEDKTEETDDHEEPRDTEIVLKSAEQEIEDDEDEGDDEEEEIVEDDEDQEEIEVDEDEEVEYEDSDDEGESENEEQRVQVVAANGNNVNNEFKNHLENNGDSASQSEDEDVEVEEIIEYVDDDDEEEDQPDDNNIEIRNANNTNGA